MIQDFVAKIKKAKLRDVVYPVATISGVIIFAIIFILSIRFLLVSINSVFAGDVDEGIVRFDIETFNKISGRLNINTQQ